MLTAARLYIFPFRLRVLQFTLDFRTAFDVFHWAQGRFNFRHLILDPHQILVDCRKSLEKDLLVKVK